MFALRHKLKSKKGFTLSELLIAVAVVSLLTIATVALAGSATKTYRNSMFVSESAVLSDTVNSALGGILRFSVPRDGSHFDFEEYEDSSFFLDGEGRLKIRTPGREKSENDLLPEGAYGKLKISDFSLSSQGKVFVVKYKVCSTGDSHSEGKEYTAYIRSTIRK